MTHLGWTVFGTVSLVLGASFAAYGYGRKRQWENDKELMDEMKSMLDRSNRSLDDALSALRKVAVDMGLRPPEPATVLRLVHKTDDEPPN